MREHVCGPVTRSCCSTAVALLGASLLAPASLAAPATTDSQERASTQLEEVVVTATRREERLRDVPQAISVLSGDQLEAIGISTAEDYASFLPGLSFNRAGFADRVGLDLTVRGVSNTRLTDASAGAGGLTTGCYIKYGALGRVEKVVCA